MFKTLKFINLLQTDSEKIIIFDTSFKNERLWQGLIVSKRHHSL